MSKNTVPLDLQDLIQLSKQQTVVVAFTASWLGASEIIDVVFEKLTALDYPKHTFIHLDIDQNKSISDFFQISELPTIITIKSGEIIDRHSSVLSKKKILGRLNLLK